MLFRKMLRELKMHFGQFFSIFLLALLAMMIYVTFEGHVLSEEIARETFHEECNLSDLWVYGEGFSKEQLETVRKLDFVKDAQLRTQIRGTAPDCDDAQVDIYMMDEERVNKGYVIDFRGSSGTCHCNIYEPYGRKTENPDWNYECHGNEAGQNFNSLCKLQYSAISTWCTCGLYEL